MRGLRWSLAGDSANTVFVEFTFFGSVFILFLDALGLSKSEIGLVLSLFPFAGLIAPFISPNVARFGYKRTFVTFWGVRKSFAALLLLTPWITVTFGEETAVLFVTVTVALFALCRAIAETGKYPWTQEYIPNQVRGKYAATSNVCTTVVGITAVAVAGYVIEFNTDLSGFMWLIGVGVVFGLVGVWAYSHIPGGAPVEYAEETHRRTLREAVQDGNFRNYLFGIALMILATVPMVSFLPLYMREEVGLRDSQVILLQNGLLVGGLLFVFIWGWAADRYGSTPVMLTGVVMRLFLPLFWLFMPQQTPISLYVALGIAFWQGISDMAWAIGSGRLLFVSIVPPAKKADYMALYYAWIGLVGGLSQLVGGWILQASEGISGQLPGLELNPYTPLFLMGLVLPLFSLLFLRRVEMDSSVSMGTFASFLFRGNPFLAVESMIRYHLAKDEQTAVRLTERLGRARSHLTVAELLEALADPRFNVRFEAIVAIGRTRPDEQLIQALANVLHSTDPALSVMAAWALGRIHDDRARDTLYAALTSDYRSIRAHSARSLGTLGDRRVIPELLTCLEMETDHGLRIAYASALGQLGAGEAAVPILCLLAEEADEMARSELALALARLVGGEHHFVQLNRQIRTDTGTALAQAMGGVLKKWGKNGTATEAAASADSHLTTAQIAFSQHDLAQGFSHLVAFLQTLPLESFNEVQTAVLSDCATRLAQFGPARPEYALLALEVLNGVG